jgi:hypothetical protein
MTAQTINERQKAFKQRHLDAGLKELRNLWAHPSDHKAIKEHALSLAVKRKKSPRP